MRLINVNTLELKEFINEKAPPYAILSHTWEGSTEVTFQEWGRAAVDDAIRSKEGYIKILGACRRARSDDLQYLWCDTNCIDKTSSAELSEAINSMFAWYRDSTVCYAYLYDVKSIDTFATSRWFTRGWTLQELLAPSKVLFFDNTWALLGDRSVLAELISEITRIHIGALMDPETIANFSVAQRMSWAADRQTSRQEDIAYCLLGIFDINMPLLYGEASRAFMRLQQEIIRKSNDQSILAWDMRYPDSCAWTGALAPSPSEFHLCGSIVRNHEYDQYAYSITNLGIAMRLALIDTLSGGIVLVGLNCVQELYKEAHHSSLPNGTKLRRHFRIWIPLRHVRHDMYDRVHHPASKIFLEQSYPILSHPTSTSLFLTLYDPQSSTTQFDRGTTEDTKLMSSILPTELLVMIASGKMTPGGHILTESYPLGDISIKQLKLRGPCTASHQLISRNGLSIILSVFWDIKMSPQDWLYTVFINPNQKFSNRLASLPEWSCLFELNKHSASDRCCNNTVAIRSLHRRLQQAYGKPSSLYAGKRSPIVDVESTPLQDLFGRIELVVEVVFQDALES
ncbi:HET-domain-containing protein [Daldinia bambusicola]|nr:HET-domain-containing protein [Daldinia bambusicola]